MAATKASAPFVVVARTSDRRDGGGLGRTTAYGQRSQPAWVLPSTWNFPLTMASPRSGSGRRPCCSRGCRRGTGGGRLRAGARPRGAAAGARAGGRAERCLSQSSSSTLSSRTLTFQLVVVWGVGEIFTEAFAGTWLCWDKPGFARPWR